MSEFDGMTALVTGGGSGIGLASALALAERGATVTVADVNIGGAKETVHEIEAAGGRARAVECDVSDESSVEAAVQAALDDAGHLHFGVNSAGLRGPGMPVNLIDYETELFDRIVAVNLRGTFLCLKHELKVMVPAGVGSIINISSGAGVVGVPGTAGYTGSKHGVVGLTKTAALDYAADGIRVNVICPGFIDTPMNQTGRTPEQVQAMINSVPVRRKGLPAEVAEAVVWLCSSHSSFVTGSVMGVDGGRSALR
jgi:NAD(P)-dependent dehydrogenase (short-subunit alcohol dehydrogenase family)